MYLDLHSHSVVSDDARATAEQYVKWILTLRSKGYQVDGFVLTEHRTWDFGADYSALSEEFGVLILKGAELDTRYGHVLVYGINNQLVEALDFGDVTLDTQRVIDEAWRAGGIAIPAHPGRRRVGLVEYVNQGVELKGLEIVEVYNHGSRPEENQRAQEFASLSELRGIGGSDAHFTSAIGSGVTEFQDPIETEKDLVAALRHGGFRAVTLEETRSHDAPRFSQQVQ